MFYRDAREVSRVMASRASVSNNDGSCDVELSRPRSHRSHPLKSFFPLFCSAFCSQLNRRRWEPMRARMATSSHEAHSSHDAQRARIVLTETLGTAQLASRASVSENRLSGLVSGRQRHCKAVHFVARYFACIKSAAASRSCSPPITPQEPQPPSHPAASVHPTRCHT